MARLTYALGILAVPVLWAVLHYWVHVPELYLPSPVAVFNGLAQFKWALTAHVGATLVIIIAGVISGIAAGTFLGTLLYSQEAMRNLLLPLVQSLRAIPPIATVPFFLLWFGFSWYGKIILVIVGTSFNLCIATLEVLNSTDDRYKVAFASFGRRPGQYWRQFCLPYALGELLPTVRFALSTTIGLVIVAELLGSQVGLGYMIQSARATFSMNVIFGATIILGISNILLDASLIALYRRVFPWKFYQFV